MDKQQMLDAVEHYVHAHFVEKNDDLFNRIIDEVCVELDVVGELTDHEDDELCDAIEGAMKACEDAAEVALSEWASAASEAAEEAA